MSESICSNLVLVTAGASIISLEDAKAHLRVDHTDDDILIGAFAVAASMALDGKEGQLGRALCTQQWKLMLPDFPCEVLLPLPPIFSVQSVKYLDEAGDEQTLSVGDYSITSGGLLRFRGTSSPEIKSDPEAVRISYTAGYGEPDDVPRPIWAAALLMVGDLYLNREATQFTTAQAVENPAVANLLGPYRVWR